MEQKIVPEKNNITFSSARSHGLRKAGQSPVSERFCPKKLLGRKIKEQHPHQVRFQIRRMFQLLEEQHRSEPHHQETACARQEACHGDRTPSLDTADTGYQIQEVCRQVYGIPQFT